MTGASPADSSERMGVDYGAPGRMYGVRWIYAASWLPILTIFVAVFVVNGMPLGVSLRAALANVLPNALFGVLILGLPRRVPWPEATRSSFFATHWGLIVAFFVACTGLWAALVNLDGFLFRDAYEWRFEARILPYRALNDILIYCTLVGLSYAWHNAAMSREQAARAARAEALRARAQLEAMRSQLNPHFILNTFHALVGLVRREPAVAEAALERLGDLLRYSLRIQRERLDEVELEEEWSFVQSYLELERLRLGDRLRVSFDAAPATLRCRIPSFALQTLVENAIRHAIAPRAEGGRVVICAQTLNGRLRIQVEDEGPGHSAKPVLESHGMGLRLLRQRLAVLYEGQASLTLHAAGGGMRAVLDLPDRYRWEQT